LVEPIIAGGIVVLVVGGNRVLGEGLDRRGLISIGALTTGVILLTFAFRSSEDPGALATTASLWLVAVCCTIAAAILVMLAFSAERAGSHGMAALTLGAAAGACYGVSSVATRQLGLLLRDFSAHAITVVLTGPTPYLLIVFGVIPLSLLQRGYQHGNPALVLPLMTAVVTILAVVAGVVLFGESLPSQGGRFAAALAGLLAVGGGVMGLFRQQGFRILT
jgi:hypothetical protein